MILSINENPKLVLDRHRTVKSRGHSIVPGYWQGQVASHCAVHVRAVGAVGRKNNCITPSSWIALHFSVSYRVCACSRSPGGNSPRTHGLWPSQSLDTDTHDWQTQKEMNHSTWQDSQVVPDLATSWAISRLSAQSKRDAELSRIYDRGWKWAVCGMYKLFWKQLQYGINPEIRCCSFTAICHKPPWVGHARPCRSRLMNAFHISVISGYANRYPL